MEKFIKEINGVVYEKNSIEYENSLLERWNIDVLSIKKPEVIVLPKDENDIINSIKYCKENNIEIGIKSGGHGFHSNCKGLLLDLKLLKGIKYNENEETVTIESGCTLGEMDKLNQKNGYVIPSGIVSDTGVCGLTLGGGLGYLTRSYGLTCDSLLQVKLITCNGDIKIVNKDTDSQLLWALKGAGSNFGVVTEMKFKLNKLNKIYFSNHSIETNENNGIEKIEKLIEFIKNNQKIKEFSVTIAINSTELLLFSVYNGDSGKSFLNDMNKIIFNEDHIDFQPIDYTTLQSCLDNALPRGKRYYKRGIFIKDELEVYHVKNIIQSFKNHPDEKNLSFTINQLGGEFSKNDNSSFSFRESLYHIAVVTKLSNENENENQQKENNHHNDKLKNQVYDWTTKTLELFSSSRIGYYSNINDSNLSTNNYYGENSKKLKDLKLKYDPNNFFNNNPNIN
ncbi:hypothetical protein RB653_002365 [Dictyostelium firmibasis]|uniref:FAD-binding PCMH-type domain-containing protein n=1 Tax=Dictyostelium firmibasis TaxID=79012 RepID=A0AAN7TQJ3_9MYCE